MRSPRPHVSPEPADTALPLDGRSALVTGAAQGVGRAVAELLAARGADVLAVDRHAEVESLPEITAGQPGTVRTRLAELGEAADLELLAQEIAEGAVDTLVNCAATYPPGGLLESTDEDWSRVLRVNVVAAASLTRAMARTLTHHRRPGTVVNVGSVQEALPLPGHSAYVASKGGLSAMTAALAVELGQHAIRVNGVTLALVHSQALDEKLGTDFWDQHDSTPPTLLGRLGTPREAAEAIAFLSSDAASYITGAVLPVDGGRRLSRHPDPQLAPAADGRNPA